MSVSIDWEMQGRSSCLDHTHTHTHTHTRNTHTKHKVLKTASHVLKLHTNQMSGAKGAKSVIWRSSLSCKIHSSGCDFTTTMVVHQKHGITNAMFKNLLWIIIPILQTLPSDPYSPSYLDTAQPVSMPLSHWSSIKNLTPVQNTLQSAGWDLYWNFPVG